MNVVFHDLPRLKIENELPHLGALGSGGLICGWIIIGISRIIIPVVRVIITCIHHGARSHKMTDPPHNGNAVEVTVHLNVQDAIAGVSPDIFLLHLVTVSLIIVIGDDLVREHLVIKSLVVQGHDGNNIGFGNRIVLLHLVKR